MDLSAELLNLVEERRAAGAPLRSLMVQLYEDQSPNDMPLEEDIISVLSDWANLYAPLRDFVEEFDYGEPWHATTKLPMPRIHDWSPDTKYWVIGTD